MRNGVPWLDEGLVVEFVLLFLVVFFAAGGGAWLGKRYLGVWRFLADRQVTYRLAAAASLLSGLAVAATSYGCHDGFRLGQAVVFGCVIALLLIPVWFVVLLVAGLLYRALLAPTLEVAGTLARAAVRPMASRRNVAVPGGDSPEAVPVPEPEGERDARRRREAARSRCEVFYALHAPEIGGRFTRSMLDDYVRRFLGDDRPPEDVEGHAAALEAVLRQHLEKVQPAPKFRSLEDIARWFEEQKQHIDAVPDDRLRQTLLAKLKARYAELTTQFLEEMQA